MLYVAFRPDKALIAIRQKSKLRDFFFCRLAEEYRIGPLRLYVAEKKHGGE
ncbi:hypothetical protein CFSAN002050_07480 [Salmonella enterica subsp. enterica serovar Cubana str. CFSAN002050]|uniref:Uncharacterized protein n=1 Tax=Salmonella enterica subsp. enterica serovar Cubana str. 76814 TaxID=1192560 RepID=V7ISP8_SALET|nr:hypothetical protein CFSAN002050_07480 [Salmonella enterica subsp. enterica serovar Cubana str. CFSAN002050]ETA89195.1 hypothetical protein A628_00819 [Salmonella enterica subsp. enterica serovar Cubana str. 76814]